MEEKTAHLTVFLIKEQYKKTNEIIVTEECDTPIEVPLSGYSNGLLFLKRTSNNIPRWATFFQGSVDPKKLKTSSVSAAFLLKVDDRYFVLSFGQGGRFLLASDVWEERFGLLVALNSLDSQSFRVVDKQSLDAIQSHTRVQSGEGTSADQFGLDVEQDMLKAIVGAPEDNNIGVRMTGTDSLSVSVRAGLDHLPDLLTVYRERFEKDLTGTEYQWVNNLAMVKTSSAVVAELETRLEAKFADKDYAKLWLAIPEIIDWATVTGFMFTNGKSVIHPDVTLEAFLSTVDKGQPVTVGILKSRRVHCADADHNRVFNDWPVYKCLYAEIEHEGSRFILNDGKWFNVNEDFVKKTDETFAKIDRSKLVLPEYSGGGEGSYNSNVATNFPDQYFLLDDTQKIFHGGGMGQVEICDLLSINGEFIHVKVYGKSSVFSHLFAQGFVSGQLLQIDSEFRAKVKMKLKGAFKSLVNENARPKDQEFAVVYAVISDSDGDDLQLPFFSRVNINNTAKILKGYGFRVQLLKIKVNAAYSKTTKIPAAKKK